MRSLGFWFKSVATPWLYVTVFGSCIIFTILVAEGVPTFLFPQKIGWWNAALAWIWSIIGMFVIDIIKQVAITVLEGSTAEIEHETVDVTELQGMEGGGFLSPAEQMQAPNLNENGVCRRTSVAIDGARKSGRPSTVGFTNTKAASFQGAFSKGKSSLTTPSIVESYVAHGGADRLSKTMSRIGGNSALIQRRRQTMA